MTSPPSGQQSALLDPPLMGLWEPQILHLPPDVHNHDAAEEALELAESVGLVPDPSQRITLRSIMAERADGSWAAYEGADIECRQNGKNDTMLCRQLWGMFVAEEPLQIHTAHVFPTANESFLRMCAVIEGSRDLSRKVRNIRYANGEQGITLRNGVRLLYRARTGGGGRGFAGVSTVYLDEALYLEPKHMGALTPAMATAQSKGLNPQLYFASSAGLSTSRLLWSLRRRALSGHGGRLAYVEHTAEVVSLDDRERVVSVRPDPDDREAWARANPTLGRRISVEFIAGQRDSLPPGEFAREHLGVWDPEPVEDNVDHPISIEEWARCMDVNSRPVGPLSLAVAVGKASASSSITAVGARSDGSPHVETQECRAGTLWLAARLREMLSSPRQQVAAVGVPPARGPVGSVLDEVERVCAAFKVPLVKLSGADYAGACSRFVELVQGEQLRHVGQVWLSTAIGGCEKDATGDVWVWDLDPTLPADPTPLISATVALRVHETRPVTAKKARVYSF